MEAVKTQVPAKVLENYNKKTSVKGLVKKAIELVGEDEVKSGLRALIRQKEADIRMEEYREKISKPIEFPTFTPGELMEWFKEQYLSLNAEPFIYDKYSRDVINALCLYFSANKTFEALDDSYSLEKGILIQGNVGCGKSSFMKIFTSNQKQSFRFASCVEISREFSTGGYAAIDKYIRLQANTLRTAFFGQELLGWCFDDLGFETNGKFFGKDSNIMLEILQAVYEDPTMRGKVHLTTNLTADAIEAHYGNRIRSRMREMFNVISYDSEAPDRRR